MTNKQSLELTYLSQKEGYIQDIKETVFRLKALKKYVELDNMTLEHYEQEKKKGLAKIERIKKKILKINDILNREKHLMLP